jgi:hypothetical protein
MKLILGRVYLFMLVKYTLMGEYVENAWKVMG